MGPLNQVLAAVRVFQDPTVRTVFDAVAKPRAILLRDLRNNVLQDEGSVSKETVEHSISVLKDADLIKERPAAIGDFSTLYLTANGLSAAQALNDPKLMSNLTTLL